MWPTEWSQPASLVLASGLYIGLINMMIIWKDARWKRRHFPLCWLDRFYGWVDSLCSKPSFLLRNPIEKVSAFLDTKHKDRFCKSQQPKISPLPTFPTLRYKMFNLCSEKTYDTSFFHGRVERVLIDDHNVPSLKQMLEFADKVSQPSEPDPNLPFIPRAG